MGVRYFSMFSGEKRKIYYDKKGYALISLDGKDVKLHVYVWEQANGKKPKGKSIHHIDHNKANFDLSNLMLVTEEEHKRIHAGWVKKGGEWYAKLCNFCKETKELGEFYARKTANTPSARCKKCHNL